MFFTHRLIVFSICLVVAACSSFPLSPYRIDIQQGNYLSQEAVSQLKPGMTKDQVRFILGTPLIMDVFHVERWDYIYRMQKGRGPIEQRKFSVFFEDGKLKKIEGDVVALPLKS